MLSEDTLNVIRALPEIELKNLASILADCTIDYLSLYNKNRDSEWYGKKELYNSYCALIKYAVDKNEIEHRFYDIIEYPSTSNMGSREWRERDSIADSPHLKERIYYISLPSLKEWLHNKGMNTRLFPLEEVADNPAKGTSIIESSILELINKEGCNPLALPMVKNGIAGIKASIKNKTDKSVSSKSFDKGWSSLLKKGLIKDLSVNNLQYSPKAFNL